uniref:Chromosomal replication initiator protein DnaA n=1 Tax=uncultured Thiotrichaceae bacterium TaxID=298394 RepID=A0A6S6SM94_9GAMM|nr:MAG: Chromosomal replication initiator protein DnaA [uncultured Thiotrichaceae bacterium]
MRQLSLNVTLPDGQSFESFCPLPGNEDILTLLQTPFWEEFPQILVFGDSGCGKSHLLQACCYRLQANFHAATYLSLRDLSRFGTGVIDGLDSGHATLLALDDIDAVMGNKAWEEALFHLVNRCRENKQALLLSAGKKPHDLGCQLPDLASRLRWGPIYQLRSLDDEQAVEVFKWRARNRGFEITEQAASYIGKNMPLDMQSLMSLLQLLDTESLNDGRKITRQFVQKVLR